MTILEQIQETKLKARRNGEYGASFFSFVQSEIEKVGKNSGNRQTTDDEAIRVIRKIIETNLKTHELSQNEDLIRENSLLERFLPQMVQDEVLVEFVRKTFSTLDNPHLGAIMKAVKQEFGTLADMNRAKEIATKLLES